MVTRANSKSSCSGKQCIQDKLILPFTGHLRWNVWHHRATALWREPWYNQKVAPSREDQTVRRTAEVRGKIVISKRIQKRPQEADDRKGYQEDLCVSYRWEDRTAIRAAEGKTQNHHAPVTQALNGLPFYFPDPHAPWQRGINENTNGLLRKYLPKSFDIALLSDRDITGFINNQLQTLQILGLESTLWSLFYQTLHLTWQFKRISCNTKKKKQPFKAASSGAVDGTWTRTHCWTRPSNVRVCRFRHNRIWK